MSRERSRTASSDVLDFFDFTSSEDSNSDAHVVPETDRFSGNLAQKFPEQEGRIDHPVLRYRSRSDSLKNRCVSSRADVRRSRSMSDITHRYTNYLGKPRRGGKPPLVSDMPLVNVLSARVRRAARASSISSLKDATNTISEAPSLHYDDRPSLIAQDPAEQPSSYRSRSESSSSLTYAVRNAATSASRRRAASMSKGKPAMRARAESGANASDTKSSTRTKIQYSIKALRRLRPPAQLPLHFSRGGRLAGSEGGASTSYQIRSKALSCETAVKESSLASLAAREESRSPAGTSRYCPQSAPRLKARVSSPVHEQRKGTVMKLGLKYGFIHMDGDDQDIFFMKQNIRNIDGRVWEPRRGDRVTFELRRRTDSKVQATHIRHLKERRSPGSRSRKTPGHQRLGWGRAMPMPSPYDGAASSPASPSPSPLRVLPSQRSPAAPTSSRWRRQPSKHLSFLSGSQQRARQHKLAVGALNDLLGPALCVQTAKGPDGTLGFGGRKKLQRHVAERGVPTYYG